MADNSTAQERTEEPTHRRLEQAREEGQIPRSQELNAAVLLLAGATLLATVGGGAMASHVITLLRADALWLSAEPLTQAGAARMLQTVVGQTVVAMLPFAAGVAGLALAIGLAQARGVVAGKPVKPDWSRISPLSGFKRIFSLDAVVNLLKASVKITVLGVVTIVVIRRAWPRLITLTENGVPEVLTVLRQSSFRLALTTGLTFLAVAAFDYAYQVWQTKKKLRMTKQEIVREHREQEGDPLIKSRIRQIARQRARRRMLQDVTRADVVVTNPTHIAVALKYDLALGLAPVVLAIGERKIAERIKEVARKAGVPLVENKPVARALLATAKVGQAIPPALYVAVAEILAFVFRQRARGLAPRPTGGRA